MKRIPQLILILMISSISLVSFAQETDKPSFENTTIDNQFNYIIDKSNHYLDFKVIKLSWVNALKTSVSDTLKAVRKKIAENQKMLVSRGSQIDSLKSKLQLANDNLASSNKERDSMKLLFVSLSKHNYAVVVWSIIIVLILVLLLFFFLYKRSNSVTLKTQQTLAETKEEFEAHRKRALEREAKLGRDYLKELNKYKNKGV